VREAAASIGASLAGVRVRFDDRGHHRPGYKFNEWELKGVPIRLEIGPRDLQSNQVVVYRRDSGEKTPVAIAELGARLPALLEQIQTNLYDQALEFRKDNTFSPANYDELKEIAIGVKGFAEAPWCGGGACEEKVKAETKATIRVLPLDPEPVEGNCIVCGAPGTEKAIWAQSY
ncbi:MAG: proline--tRNA ligase anticodon binding domain-containing protein, partial [Actinomycetota bacterium]